MNDQPSTPREPHQHLVDADEILAERADHLAAILQGLRVTVAALDKRAQHIEDRANSADQKAVRVAKSNRRAIIALVIVAAFTVLGAGLIINQRGTVNRLDQVVATVQDQQAQSVQLRQLGLCPVFQSAIAAGGPQARTVFAAGPLAYDEFVARLKKSIQIMQCQPLDKPLPGGH